VERISVFRNVEIFLDYASHIGEKRPVGANPAAIFTRVSNVVRANCNKPAIANLHLTMQFKKPFRLPAILGAITATAEDNDHGMLSLQFGELSTLSGVIRKLVVGEDRF
jgi:hypothetical protein